MRSLLLISLFLGGCASVTKQSDALLSTHQHAFKSSAQVSGVPFINQKVGQCGPATLTMAMNWAEKLITVDEVLPQVYTPGMKGSFQMDMITTARRQGLLAIPISGLNDVLTEVDRGHPVIVFENLALSWLPQWHYAIVFGYDLKNKTLLMHSGPEKNKKSDFREFEKSWRLADYWGLVVLPPNELSATASELEHAKAAVAFEQIGKPEIAATAYQTMLTRWPQSLSALVGMGNWEYMQGHLAKSIKYFKRASLEHPNSEAARHNLAVAEAASKELISVQ